MRQYLLVGGILVLLLACCPCGTFIALVEEAMETLPDDDGGITQPDFTLESLDGTQVTLSDLRGQIVVLDFWATWCGPCLEGMPHLQDIHDRYADDGVVVLAINIEESRSEIERYLDGDYTFTILLDSDGEVADKYRVWAIPHTIVVDPSGAGQEVPMGPQGTETVVQEMLND